MLLTPWLSLPGPGPAPARAETPRVPLELVQTWPIEVEELRAPELREAHVVWLEMIERAQRNIDLAHFYASNEPGSRLETVISALEHAARRGVAIRFLAEQAFVETYPETLERLAAEPGIEVRRYDVRARMGGVLHAKLMMVDATELFVGSQNFDWRALEHIQEIGLRTTAASVVRAYADLFATDWALAAGAPDHFRVAPPADGYGFPVRSTYAGGHVALTAVFSPRGWLPDESLWDLPRLLEMIDGARERVRVQLLSYQAVDRDGEYWPTLENALRAAAARGVEVQLLLSHWEQRAERIAGLKSLQCLPRITVRMLPLPEWSGGFLPFARVAHAKYMVVDGARGWLGTSNWQKGYFLTGRNAGVVFDGAALAADLDAFFERGWSSRYAETVDPGRDYPEPRIDE